MPSSKRHTASAACARKSPSLLSMAGRYSSSRRTANQPEMARRISPPNTATIRAANAKMRRAASLRQKGSRGLTSLNVTSIGFISPSVNKGPEYGYDPASAQADRRDGHSAAADAGGAGPDHEGAARAGRDRRRPPRHPGSHHRLQPGHRRAETTRQRTHKAGRRRTN